MRNDEIRRRNKEYEEKRQCVNIKKKTMNKDKEMELRERYENLMEEDAKHKAELD